MAKSQVYSQGRNYKVRSRRKNTFGPYHASAGNINMHGKKTRLMACRCCVCIDMRDDIHEKEHREEMEKYKKGEET